MACKNVCSLCKNLIISTGVSFTDGNLVIDLPAGSYANGRKICVVIAQAIPDTTTINAPVVFTIGGTDTQYPLVNKCCRQISACGVRTRTKYSVTVQTTATGATFRMLGNPACQPNNDLTAVDGTAPTTTTPAAGA